MNFHDLQTALNLAASLGPINLRMSIKMSTGMRSKAPVEDDGIYIICRKRSKDEELEFDFEDEVLETDSQTFLNNVAAILNWNVRF